MPLARQNSVQFSLYSKSRGWVDIPEPVNYEDGNGNIYERDKDAKGFLTTKSNSLQFFDEGYDFIIGQYATKGIAEDVILRKKMKSDNRIDEKWITVSETFLDLGKGKFDDKKRTFSTQAIQGGLYKLVDDNKDKDLDLTTKIALDGTEIEDLNTIDLELKPKEILLRSEGTVEPGTQIKAVVGDSLNARCFPFKFDPNSDKDNIGDAYGDQLSANNGFYANLTFDKSTNLIMSNVSTYKKLTLNGRVRAEIIAPNIGTCRMDIIVYRDGLDYVYDRVEPLDTCNPNILGDAIEFDFNDYNLELEEGESFAIGMLSDTFDGIRYEVIEANLEITENSGEFLPTTYTRALTEFETGNRLIEMITGQKDLFRCSFLEEGGEHEGKLLASGFWIRGFPDVIKEGTENERKIPFTTSFESFLKHLDARNPIAYWTEIENNKEVFRVEFLKQTQQNFTGIKYGETIGKFQYIQASDIKRTNLENNFYNILEFGFSKGGDNYEEVSGLQSISGKATYSTINPGKSKYSKVSPYRGGDLDVEFPRRLQYEDYPDRDTPYDSDIMSIVCKIENATYKVKYWQDIYETRPKGLLRPDSAYNFENTPTRFLLNHSYVINVGLYHYPFESIRGYDSNCNGSFASKKAGEVEIKENEPIPHSLLEKPRVKPTSVDLTLKVNQELESQIKGKSNGTQNWFGLVAVDTGGSIEYMRLVKVDTNKEGKHKLVEAYI